MANEHVSWDYYDDDEFSKVSKKYLPKENEGSTMANQIVTAISKLVYRYYNDGDVIDNSWTMEDACYYEDFTSFANWLYENVPTAKEVFDKYIGKISTEEDYENMLKDLSDKCFNMEFLKSYEDKEKIGTIYECDGVFELQEFEDEDDWY